METMVMKRIPKTSLGDGLSKEDRIFLKAFEESSQRHVDKVTRSRKAALQDLIDAGIYGKNGKLTKRYRSVA